MGRFPMLRAFMFVPGSHKRAGELGSSSCVCMGVRWEKSKVQTPPSPTEIWDWLQSLVAIKANCRIPLQNDG